MIPVRDEQIGGAVVRRRIDRGALPPLHAGYVMSREEILAMPVANRRALVANETIWLAPLTDDQVVAEAPRRGRPPKHFSSHTNNN